MSFARSFCTPSLSARITLPISGSYSLRASIADSALRSWNHKIQIIIKGRISSEKYWYYFNCPKNVLCSILSFVFWIFPPLDTAVQLESQLTVNRTQFQNLFFRIVFGTFFGQWEKSYFLKKATFRTIKICCLLMLPLLNTNLIRLWPHCAVLEQKIQGFFHQH